LHDRVFDTESLRKARLEHCLPSVSPARLSALVF